MIRVSIKIDGVQISNHDLASVSLQQEVADHHHFQIKFRREQESHELSHYASQYIGSSVTIGFDDADNDGIDSARIKDVFKGVITGVSVASQENGTNVMIIRGMSPTIHLEDGPQCCTYSDMGIQEIVDKICQKYSSKFQDGIEVAPQYSAVLDYTVQYKETHFEFLQRLAAKFGEWFYYDGFSLRYGHQPGGNPTDLSFGADALVSYELTVQAKPYKLKVRGYDYQENKVIESAAYQTQKKGYAEKALTAGNNIFEYDTEVSDENQSHTKKDLEDIIKRYEDKSTEDVVVLRGTSSNGILTIGSVINLTDNSYGESHGEYIISRISHTVNQTGGYENEFEAYPSDMKTPPSKILGVHPNCEAQIAEVVSVDDPDGYGRISVRFAWQQADGAQSPFIRVVTPYTTQSSGFYFTPEEGENVLVAFENNNPDRPYVAGGMYHAKSPPENYDAKNNFKGIKTRGKNELKFDDQEQVTRLYAEKKLEFVAGEEIEIKTEQKGANSITLDVGTSGIVTIKAGTVIIEANKEMSVDSKGSVDVKATQSMKLSGLDATLEGKTKSEIKGATVNVSGSAATVVKGGIIKLN